MSNLSTNKAHNQALKKPAERVLLTQCPTHNEPFFTLTFKKMVAHFIFQSLLCKIALISMIHPTAATIKLLFFINGVDI